MKNKKHITNTYAEIGNVCELDAEIEKYFLNFGRNLSQFSFARAGSFSSSFFIMRIYKSKGETEERKKEGQRTNMNISQCTENI